MKSNVLVKTRWKLLVYLIPLIVFNLSCGDDNELVETKNIDRSRRKTNTVINRDDRIKEFRKKGTVLDVPTEQSEKLAINIWNNTNYPKTSLYQLTPNEEVLIYARKGEYYYVAPVKDTTAAGYILKGWIDTTGKDNRLVSTTKNTSSYISNYSGTKKDYLNFNTTKKYLTYKSIEKTEEIKDSTTLSSDSSINDY